MTEVQKLHGPFASEPPKFWPNAPKFLVTRGVNDRVALVRKSTDQEWLGDVLKRAEENTVRVAAARRLKKLLHPKVPKELGKV